MFYKLILEGGHVGAGKSYDVVRFFQGEDILSVMARAVKMPRLKQKEYGKGIKFIQEISWNEYLAGKRREQRDPYLNCH